MLILALLVSAASSPTTTAPVEKSAIPLTAAVDASTFVCIGTVERVETLRLPAGWGEESIHSAPEIATFGRIRVERVLKGDPDTKTAWHETWKSWTCDMTTAHEGERCLFFLQPGAVSRANVEIRDAVARGLGVAPVYSNVGSGDGIVPILAREGVECVKFHVAPTAMQLEGVPYHQRLAPLIEHVETLARFAPNRVAIHATTRRDPPKWKAFDLRIRADGAVRLATGSGAGEVARVSQLDESNWRTLRTSITRTLGSAPISFGDPDTFNPYRSLRVALPGVALSFVDDDSVIVSGMEDDEFARYRATIDAWRLVRSAIDCPDCVDHSARDAELLKR